MHKNQIYNLFYFTFLFLNELRNNKFITDDYYLEKFKRFFEQTTNIKNIKDFFDLIQDVEKSQGKDYVKYVILCFEKLFNIKISNLPDDDKKYLLHTILHRHIIEFLKKYNREINLICLTEEIDS